MEFNQIIIALFFGGIVGFLLDNMIQKMDFEEIPIKNQLKKKSKFALIAICAILTTALFVKLGLTLDFFVFLAIFYLLTFLSFIDLKYHCVPDYLLLVVFILVFCIPSIDVFTQFKNASLVCGGVVLLNFVLNFYIQNIKRKITKNENLKYQTALGEGDIPIIAVISASLDIKSAIFAIFLAAIFAIIPALYNIKAKQEMETPFIPFLSLGFFVEFIFTFSKVFN